MPPQSSQPLESQSRRLVSQSLRLVSQSRRLVSMLVLVSLLDVVSANHQNGLSERIVVKTTASESEVRRMADENGLIFRKRVMDDYYLLEDREPDLALAREAREQELPVEQLRSRAEVEWTSREAIKHNSKRDLIPALGSRSSLADMGFNDPLYPKQWYYDSIGESGIPEGNDHSIVDVWRMGLDGSGIKVVVIDDGIDYTHPELAPNANRSLFLDLNDRDDDPYPRIPEEDPEFNSHGTKCAGQIAAVANNGICGVGIAHMAQIGGIRLLDGKVTDSLEAEAFRFKCEDVDIYSMSWGPTDNGKTFGGFGKLSYAAIEHCIKHGRGGLGSIYVWASGNGGMVGDDCNADSLVSSPYTISIGALTAAGKPAYFQETCASTLVVVYSGGISRTTYDDLAVGNGQHEKTHPMVTSNIMFNSAEPAAAENCDEHFSGTSAAGPLGAGMIALTLQANPELTWRDIQHIIVETADQPNPDKSDSRINWRINGDGRTVNHDYGFGVMNAAKMAVTAKGWRHVPDRLECRLRPAGQPGSCSGGGGQSCAMPTSESEAVVYTFSTCDQPVNFAEHVVAVVSYQASFRGAVVIRVTSPSGFTSEVMRPRRLDDSGEAIDNWPFVTVLNWGEKVEGEWRVSIFADTAVIENSSQRNNFHGKVLGVKLVVYGTETRHDNPSKSDPSRVAAPESREESKILDHHYETDREDSELIDKILDEGGDVERRGGSDGGLLADAIARELGTLDDFLDPYANRPKASGEYSPREHRRGWRKRLGF